MVVDKNQTKTISPDKPILQISAHSIQGKRNHMEDFFDIGYQMKNCDQRRPDEWPYEYFYFGIFDGHGGCEAAKFAKENLLKFIVQEKTFWSTSDDDVMRAIKDGFAKTQTEMRKALPDWLRTTRILPSTAGTTASIIFIKNGKYYIGHVGDSRVVVARSDPSTDYWRPVESTTDHKPESIEEISRIEDAGGEVRTKIGVHRVVWRRPIFVPNGSKEPNEEQIKQFRELVPEYPVPDSLVHTYQNIPFLAIARSLGDFWSINPENGRYIVSPEPDVYCRPIDGNDKAILLATDGLWNMIGNSKAIKFLEELKARTPALGGAFNGKRSRGDSLSSNDSDIDDDSRRYYHIDNYYDVAGYDPENYALRLVYIAFQNWERKRLRSDNITAVVVMLSDILAMATNSCPKKSYITRSSSRTSLDTVDSDKIKAEVVQIGYTRTFSEPVYSHEPPKLCCKQKQSVEDWLEIERSLLLPPSIMKRHLHSKSDLIICPRNYARLSDASYRLISPEPSARNSDSKILILYASDDPDDDSEGDRYTNKSGKLVRNSTTQFSESLHDFGQPWREIHRPQSTGRWVMYWGDDDIDDEEDEDGRAEEIGEDDCMGEDKEEEDDRSSNEDYSELSASEFTGLFPGMYPLTEEKDEPKDCEGDEEGVVYTSLKDKLQAMENWEGQRKSDVTPRYPTRGAYQSLSENSKRRNQNNQSSVRAKRRRSQPNRCSAQRSLSP